MKTIDFTPVAGKGFLFDEDVMGIVQNEITDVAGLATLAGNRYILKGCEAVAGNILPGVVVINGEILKFEGGIPGPKVVIIETRTQRNSLDFATGNIELRDAIIERVARFGDDGSVNPILWADFKRHDPNNGLLARVELLEKMLKPLMPYTVEGTTVHGSRLEWNRPANEIPAGWVADDDPAIAGKFPVGYQATDPDFDTIGDTGGNKTHALTEAELPQISIDLGLRKSNNNYGLGNLNGPIIDHSNPALNEKATFGGNQPFPILNPYRVVRYIIFTGA